MDGVRAYWDTQKLISRHGNIISSPEWFISGLSKDISLDGELWMGTGTTHGDLMKVLKSKNGDWSQVGYYVFDVPSSHNETYERRMEQMETNSLNLPAHVHIVENIQCRGIEHLQEYLSSIITAQGEGIILRKPQTSYEIGYTSSVLKVKV